MHNEMVERVAKAICVYWVEHGFDPSKPSEKAAVAAIEAMREPTAPMIECAGGTPKQKMNMALRYKDMIDAASDVEFY